MAKNLEEGGKMGIFLKKDIRKNLYSSIQIGVFDIFLPRNIQFFEYNIKGGDKHEVEQKMVQRLWTTTLVLLERGGAFQTSQEISRRGGERRLQRMAPGEEEASGGEDQGDRGGAEGTGRGELNSRGGDSASPLFFGADIVRPLFIPYPSIK